MVNMRLIDVDALNTYDVSPAYGMTVIGLTEEDIELAPTVEAIPVEFIRHWIHELNRVRSNGKVWAAIVLQALLDAWARAERKEE